MAFHDDLLAQAFLLPEQIPENQANLRRAISAAYYALFHLLIHECVANWSVPGSRPSLARMFEHSVMKRVSRRIIDLKQSAVRGEDPEVVEKLREVAGAFVLLQENRQTADYDNIVTWTKTDAIEEVRRAQADFESWHIIRHTSIAQDYLVSLLIKPRD